MFPEIVILLDTSLSIHKYITFYVEGINYLINTQKQINPRTRLTIIEFNNYIKLYCMNVALENIPVISPKDINVFGCTSLYDAIGYSIELKKYEKKPTIFIVITDGNDNYSKKYSNIDIINIISKIPKNVFNFIYVGGDQDAKTEGNNLGIDNCIKFSSSNQSIKIVFDMINRLINKLSYQMTGDINMLSNINNVDIMDDVSDLFLNSLNI